MLEIKNLSVSIHGKPILEGLDLTVNAGEIAAIVCGEAFDDLDGPIVRVTAPDAPVPSAPALEERFLPNAAGIAEAARRLAQA